MKKLTKEEAEKIITNVSGNSSLLRNTMLAMKTGEIILVEPKDWKWKTKTPSTMCRRLERGSSLKFTCKEAVDGSGWLIERIA